MERLFMSVLEMGLRGSVVIGAVLLARLLLRKAPAVARYALWGLVAVALVVPLRFETALSLMPAASAEEPVTVIRESTPRGETGLTELEPEQVPEIFVMLTQSDVGPRFLSTKSVAAWVWSAGVSGMLLWAAVSWLSLLRRVRPAVCLKENIYFCDHIPSPFVLGLFRPRIYLPSDLPEELQRPVLAHERGHIFRWDHVARLLALGILAVYWWDPLVWLAFVLFCRDMEMACDEWVIRTLDREEVRRYSEALIACSLPKASLRSFHLAFGEVGIRSRVKNILHYKKPGIWITLAAAVLAAVVAVCFLTERPPEEAFVPETEPQVSWTDARAETQEQAVTDTAPTDPGIEPPLELTGALSPDGARAIADFRDGTGYQFFSDEAAELVRLLNALTAEDFVYEPQMAPVLSVTLTASGRDVYLESDTDLVILVHDGIRWGIRDEALNEFFRLLYSVTDYEEQNVVPLQDVREHYSMEEAMIDLCVIQEEGVLRYNADVWEAFCASCRDGGPAMVRIWERSGDRTLVWDLSYDGYSYCRYLYENGELSTQRWSYLHCFSGDAGEGTRDHYHYEHFVLSDDPDCTWDEGSRSLHHSTGHHGEHHDRGGSHHTVCSIYAYYPNHPALHGVLQKVELRMDGKVISSVVVPDVLEDIQALFEEAEETYEPKTYNLATELWLYFEGKTVRVGLDLNYDLCVIDGYFYDYGPGYDDDGSLNRLPDLLRLLGFSRWPDQVQDRYGDHIWS